MTYNVFGGTLVLLLSKKCDTTVCEDYTLVRDDGDVWLWQFGIGNGIVHIN